MNADENDLLPPAQESLTDDAGAVDLPDLGDDGALAEEEAPEAASEDAQDQTPSEGWDEVPGNAAEDQQSSAASSEPIGPGTYEVQQGDCISSIAFRAGFFPDTLWKHPENADLKQFREDPNVLLAGDRVFIPEKDLTPETASTEQHHRFRRKGVPEKLRLQLLRLGSPRKDAAYDLVVDGTRTRGKTDAAGWVVQSIPPAARSARLIVDPDSEADEYEIVLGGLDPKDTIAGVQERLANLGYDCPASSRLDGRTRAALRRFQEAHDLKATGEVDEDTTAALEKAYTEGAQMP